MSGLQNYPPHMLSRPEIRKKAQTLVAFSEKSSIVIKNRKNKSITYSKLNFTCNLDTFGNKIELKNVSKRREFGFENNFNTFQINDI